MRTRVLPAGDRGLLVEVDDLDTVLALADRLRAADLAGVQDVVPASRTVLVRTGPGRDLSRLGNEILDLAGDLPVDAATDATRGGCSTSGCGTTARTWTRWPRSPG